MFKTPLAFILGHILFNALKYYWNYLGKKKRLSNRLILNRKEGFILLKGMILKRGWGEAEGYDKNLPLALPY
jgi:hypothetical protein